MDPEPVMRKRMPIAKPIGEFENGPYKGVLDRRVIREMLANYAFKTEVPVFLWDHVEDLDEREPDGWVEPPLEIDERGWLWGTVKLHGEAVRLVGNDRIRQLSPAWRPVAKDYKGNPIGAMLMHVTLTNNPYIKDFPNIAAARSVGGESLLMCLTALSPEEAFMADEKDKEIARLKDELAAAKAHTPDEAATAKLKEAEGLLAEKIRECAEKDSTIAERDATIANLTDDVERYSKDAGKGEWLKEREQMQQQLKALRIRDLVKAGVAAGQFNLGFVGEADKGYAHKSDSMVLKWFKEHKHFQGSMDRLEFALDTFEKKTLNRPFRSGAPASDDGEVRLTEDAITELRRLGIEPEKVKAAMKAGNASEYASLTAKEK